MKLGLAGSVEFDDNVLRSGDDENKDGDVVFRITPSVGFLEDEGKFHWNLGYSFPWERAVRTNAVSDVRHFLTAKASHQASERTRTFFTDSFSYTDSVRYFSTISEDGAVPTLGTFREPVIRNNATLGVQHSFTPLLMGNLTFSNRLFDTDIARRSNAMVYGANTNLVYSVSSHHQLGGGAAVTYQDFKESNDGAIAPSQAFFLNVYGTWTWTIDETLTFELTVGPTFVDNNQDAQPTQLTGPEFPNQELGGEFIAYDFSTCETVNGQRVFSGCVLNTALTLSAPQASDTTDLSFVDGTNTGGSDSNWTFFGEAKLSKRWSPTLRSTFTYRRSESTASGAGSATLDLVSLLTTWRISELWDAGLRADFTRRESTAPRQETLIVVGPAPSPPSVPLIDAAESIGLTARTVDSSLDTNRWGVSARMSRRLTKRIHASLRYAYNEQTSKSGTTGSSSDFSNHLVTLGVKYNFDRWHLW